MCEVSAYRCSEIREMPLWSGNRHDGSFSGVLERQGETVLLIDMATLFAEAFSRVESHTSLHREGSDGNEGKGRLNEADVRTATFITFELDEIYGVPIEHVREIVPVASGIKHVPGQCDHVQGLISLRSEIIPVVNLRRYLDSGDGEEGRETLIMILSMDNRQVGILIDRLLEITKVPVGDMANVAALLSQNRMARCRDLAERVVSIDNRKGEALPVVILDIEKLMMKMN
jgi:purine-binding chemotaxis protein CheW